MSPFLFLVLLFVVVGLARSAALRSPQGGALRAKRRARPTAVAPRRPPASRPASASRAGQPVATDAPLAVPTSVGPSADSARLAAPHLAGKSPLPVAR